MRYLFILILFFGCKAKHTTTTVTKTDTIFTEKVVKITEPVLNEIVIEKPCDSLGNLKPINVVSTTGKVKSTLKSSGNTLKLEVNVDSLVDSRIKEFKSSYKAEKIEVETIKYKNKRLMWYSLVLNLLLLGWIFRNPLLKYI